ncbi:O-antigen ligase family protein [Fervidibacillus albus]|uniref:O-antigen ligase family protein n=1 Tax=Fervidibacillus albus TaxID=2980026 RepID=A0A9E8LU62_9BACI|nr:O-antigen ligase family protein [Fervidibacillus albus]WAA09715.1 O-antigen ligase family protein [Fervidibacillus albus]
MLTYLLLLYGVFSRSIFSKSIIFYAVEIIFILGIPVYFILKYGLKKSLNNTKFEVIEWIFILSIISYFINIILFYDKKILNIVFFLPTIMGFLLYYYNKTKDNILFTKEIQNGLLFASKGIILSIIGFEIINRKIQVYEIKLPKFMASYFLHPNDLGLTISVLTIIIFITKRKGSKIDILFILLGIIILYLTKSRTYLVALTFYFVIYAFLRNKRLTTFVIIFIISILLIPNAQESILENNIITNKYENNTGQNNLLFTGREYIWSGGIKVIKENFLIGIGSQNIPDKVTPLIPDYLYLKENDAIAKASLHNVYLDVLLSMGIFGFVFTFLFFGYRIIKSTMYVVKNNNDLFFTKLYCFVIYVLAAAFVYSDLYFTRNILQIFFWIFLSVMSVLERKEKNV